MTHRPSFTRKHCSCGWISPLRASRTAPEVMDAEWKIHVREANKANGVVSHRSAVRTAIRRGEKLP